MKLTIQLQLIAGVQKQNLLDTMRAFNAAASYAARVGFTNKVFGQVNLHRLTYHDIRKKFGLSAQMAVRAIGKAVECFQRDKKICPVFKQCGAITYDQRILSFKGLTEVSLWTMAGRVRLPFVCGAYQKALQGRVKGQADLVYRQGKFYLLCTVDMPEGSPIKPVDVLGVDLGIVNVAVDSTGEKFTGKHVDIVRSHYAERRRVLNRVGTKSARRRLCKIRRHESNFRRNENHCIAKRLVLKAKATGCAIAVEDLNGIRDRVSVRSTQRARHHGWSFRQLRSFLEYKAKLAGVPIVIVDPRNTSRTCPECGHCAKSNRKSQSEFLCGQCSYSENADYIGARNVRARGIVTMPMVGVVEAKTDLRDCG